MRISKKSNGQVQINGKVALTPDAASRLCIAAIVSALLVLSANQALAQDTKQDTKSDFPLSFSVSPRFYATWIETDEFSEPVFVPMGGLSVSVAHARLPDWDFTLNGLYGQGDGDFKAAAKNTGFGFGGDGHVDVERADIEFLVRYRFPETGAYVAAGFRYINFQEDLFLNEDQPFFLAGKVGEFTNKVYLGEFGGGFARRISKSGRHSLFGNLLFGLGQGTADGQNLNCTKVNAAECAGSRGDDGFAFMVDTNVGYQYVIKSWSSLSVRYRLIAVHDSIGEDSNLSIVHGPDIAATFRF